MKKSKAQQLLSEHCSGCYDPPHSSKLRRDAADNEDVSLGRGTTDLWGTTYDIHDVCPSRTPQPIRPSFRYLGTYYRPPINNGRRILQIKCKEDIKVILGEEAHKWGLHTSTQKEHGLFVKLATEEAINCYHGNEVGSWCPPDTSASVPRNFHDAIGFLLKHFLRRSTGDGRRLKFTRTLDSIETNFGVYIPYPPYNVLRDGTLEINGEYALHEGIVESDLYLDPLKRFSYYVKDAKEAIIDDWSSSLSKGKPNHIAEAAAIHEAIHGGHSCLKCNAENSFRFNSNMNVSFSDVLCHACGSIYTFWGVWNEMSIQKNFKRGNINKNRQYADYYHEKKNLKQDSEMFAIFVGMADMTEMPVYAARITGALPNFSSRSFNLQKIRVFCNVQLNPMLNSQRWFVIYPPVDMTHDALKRLSFDATAEYFSKLNASVGAEISQNNLEDSKPSVKRSDGNLRSEIRRLRRKRNQIESIKKRIDEGGSTEKGDIDMIAEEHELLGQLARLERILTFEP